MSGFKLAGGIDLSASALAMSAKQYSIPQAFIQKLVKSFFDALYVFMDGLILLASDELPSGTENVLAIEVSSTGPNPLELLDLKDMVTTSRRSGRHFPIDGF